MTPANTDGSPIYPAIRIYSSESKSIIFHSDIWKHLTNIICTHKTKHKIEYIRIKQFIILGHELFATKKINESLYRKLQLITYSRTTEQKLKDSYKTLKDIDNNIKQSETSQDKQKGAPKPKKITVKAFTENKKIVDEDSSILYNIYLKYKVWYIIDKKSDRSKDFVLKC